MEKFKKFAARRKWKVSDFPVILSLIFTHSNSSFKKIITAPNYKARPVTHHNPRTLHFDSFLPKSLHRHFNVTTIAAGSP